jgi:hypothetical protein
MRIETQPYSKVRPYTAPEKGDLFGDNGTKVATLARITQSGFIKCPHCINGAARQMVDGKDLIWVCLMCGWDKPVREPAQKTYGEREAGSYDTKRY